MGKRKKIVDIPTIKTRFLYKSTTTLLLFYYYVKLTNYGYYMWQQLHPF